MNRIVVRVSYPTYRDFTNNTVLPENKIKLLFIDGDPVRGGARFMRGKFTQFHIRDKPFTFGYGPAVKVADEDCPACSLPGKYHNDVIQLTVTDRGVCWRQRNVFAISYRLL